MTVHSRLLNPIVGSRLSFWIAQSKKEGTKNGGCSPWRSSPDKFKKDAAPAMPAIRPVSAPPAKSANIGRVARGAGAAVRAR